MAQSKFLLNGQQVELVQTLENGFLVTRIYHEDDSAEEYFSDNGKPFFVDKVYDKAPTEVLDKAIIALEQQISEYTEKRNAIQKEFWELDKSFKEKTKLLKNYQHPAVNLFTNYLENTITHFVVSQYGRVDLIERKKLFRHESDFKLFFEIDFTANEIKWGTYLRRDYDRVGAFPCSSLEEAQTQLTRIFNQAWADEKMTYASTFINSAKKLGIEVPAEFINKIKESRKKEIEFSIEGLNKQLSDRLNELKNL